MEANQNPQAKVHMLSGVLCGLTVLPLNPPRPIVAALVVGLTVVAVSTLLFDPRGREVLLIKLSLWIKGSLMMVIGRDKKWKKKGRPDPAEVANAKDKRIKRLVLIRHGESEWNNVFNIGPKIFVPIKAILALAREFLMVLQLSPNSIFYDSPLNESGLRQAEELDEIFYNYNDPSAPGYEEILKINKGNCVYATSTLRRSVQTIVLALKTRLENNRDDKVLLLSSLQEISTNVDTLALTPPLKSPVLPNISEFLTDPERFDASGNSGNKLLRGNGLQRMQAFAEWVFTRDEDLILVGGHSLWFRSFFREFLPKDANPFDARNMKIANGAVVAITLERGTIDDSVAIQYRIDPDSIVEIHIGFEKKKAKKKKVT
uniref:Uncharacterized protein n=1 Tax=Aureoumbra lagunensis TaxID=44058 RepID=A0A7S3JMW5_9STRA